MYNQVREIDGDREIFRDSENKYIKLMYVPSVNFRKRLIDALKN